MRRARAQRARPSVVRGPVLRPPWRRQRPLRMAGCRQQPPARVWAPQRGAARKSPGVAPLRRRPRRSGGRLVVEARGEYEGWSPCPAVRATAADAVIGGLNVQNSVAEVREMFYTILVLIVNAGVDRKVNFGVAV